MIMSTTSIFQKAGALVRNDHGCDFTVWAPFARHVRLHLIHPKNTEIEMNGGDFGYWRASHEKSGPGTLYLYRIDEKDPLPDPASFCQPQGVHGPSEVTDLKRFRWTDSSWKGIQPDEMLFYELHTGTFTEEGKFEGIIQRLDYLLDLGITVIELMPVVQFPGQRNWGYDGVYPFAVQQSYGGAERLMQLVNSCHNNGIAVFLDVIYNHLGPEGNYLGEYGPYFTDRYKTPWGKAVNFDDRHSYGVRNYFVQNALMWLEDFHIDGLRLDAVHAIYDFSARHITQELAEHVQELNKHSAQKHYLIAESALNNNRYINDIASDGYGLDGQWNDDFHHGIHALVTGEKNGYYVDFTDPELLVKAYTRGYAYSGQYSEFRKRRFGNDSIANPGKQFVVFSQNHDQVGNRKLGERLSTLVDFEILKVIAGAVFISPFIPLLFMGEEYGEQHPFLYFVDHNDAELNRLVREGRQKEFESFYPDDITPAPDPSDIHTFLNSRLTDDPLHDKSRAALHSYYRMLINLKKNHSVLKKLNKKTIRVTQSNRVFAIERWNETSRIMAWLNFSDQPAERKLPESFDTGEAAELIVNSSDSHWGGHGRKAKSKAVAGEKITVAEETILIYSFIKD